MEDYIFLHNYTVDEIFGLTWQKFFITSIKWGNIFLEECGSTPLATPSNH